MNRRTRVFSPTGASIAGRLMSFVAVLAFVALAGCSSGTATGGAAPASSTIESSPSGERANLHGTERSTESGSQNQNGDVRAREPVASANGGAAASGANARGAARVAEEIECRRGMAQAVTVHEAATVEALLEEGLRLAGVSPAHLAIRGTAGAATVRCAWRGIARTAAQREDAIRFWLRIGTGEAIPDAAYLEAFFTTFLDTLNPEYRETAKSNSLAIARGGLSEEYLFLTCFADFTVSDYLLGAGPTTVTVAYDQRGEARSYDLYRREHEAGTYGTDALQTRGTTKRRCRRSWWRRRSCWRRRSAARSGSCSWRRWGRTTRLPSRSGRRWRTGTWRRWMAQSTRCGWGRPRETRSTRRRWPT